jgi:putative acetyltransferase
MAVLPAWQGRGVGSALVEAGLAACRETDAALVVVLGHPAFYPRFGFAPAWEAGLFYDRPGPNPAFMVCALVPGGLEGCGGRVRYDPAFDAV